MTITVDAVHLTMIFSAIVAALTGYGVLIMVIWQSLNNRLRSLGHEDRDIRNQIHGLLEVLDAHHRDTLKAVVQTNALMANVYSNAVPQRRELEA